MNMKFIYALIIVCTLAWTIASICGFSSFTFDNDVEVVELPSYFYRKFRKKYTKLGSLIPTFFITISALPVLIPCSIVKLILMGINGIKKLYDRIFIEKPKPEPKAVFMTPSIENSFEKPEVPVIHVLEDTKYERG